MLHIRYGEVEHELIDLQKVLENSLKDASLDIARVNHNCEKFQKAVAKHPTLEKASYVVFSKYMLQYHSNEMFVFLDKTGNVVDTACGKEFWLHGMIKECTVLDDEINNSSSYLYAS
jgi:hypothetical protein